MWGPKGRAMRQDGRRVRAQWHTPEHTVIRGSFHSYSTSEHGPTVMSQGAATPRAEMTSSHHVVMSRDIIKSLLGSPFFRPWEHFPKVICQSLLQQMSAGKRHGHVCALEFPRVWFAFWRLFKTLEHTCGHNMATQFPLLGWYQGQTAPHIATPLWP